MFSGLNQSANLSFYNLSFSGSVVALRDGISCGSICGAITNIGDDYFFNVSQFTNYSVEGNLLPEAQNVSIDSSDNLNRTNGTLNGSFDYYDGNGDVQSANETNWYKDGGLFYYLSEDDTEDENGSDGNITNGDNAYDEDWSNYVEVYSIGGSSFSGNIYENYTVSGSVENINWTVKYRTYEIYIDKFNFGTAIFKGYIVD